ncbi:MAG: TlpA family protein disulfide reductase [Nocardioidaceae bacterium]|nr:TlpA family protein disulfide reductase [Nocardioidaceae bacterium]
MANPLTGGYEAVVQVAVRQVDGLLGTLHQRGDVEGAPLKLLHSTSLRVGDPRRGPRDFEAFGDWVVAYQRAGPPLGLRDLGTELSGKAPPGVAKILGDAFGGLDEDWVFEDPPDVVRGRAKLQLSSVTLSVPDGSTSEVSVHAHVRAHYYPDSATTDMPVPVHGEVSAAFEVRRVQSAAGRRLLIQPSAQDSKIQFAAAPGSGLTSIDASRIAAQVRKALRESFTLLPVDLPSDFPFADFKGVGSGPSRAIALPLQLSGAGAPAGGLHGITHSITGGSGFAFAVRREHVSSLIDIEAIRAAIRRRRIPLTVDLGWLGSIAVTYRLRFSSGPTLTFKAGAIEIGGRVEVETDTTVAPNGFVSFKQAVTLVLDASSQIVGLEAVSDPEVDESLFIPHSLAVSIVKTEIAKALASNALSIRRVFEDAQSNLVGGLKTFEPFASATYTGVEITPDGVIARGDIGSLGRRPPVVKVDETHGGAAFTAFESWIPAGRIARLVWSWVEHAHPASIWGTEKSFADEHRFILPKPSGVTSLSQICLRVEGSQIGPGGHESAIAAGTTCHLPDTGLAIDAPSWWEPVTMPVWLPDVADDAVLRDAVAAHLSVQRDLPPRDEPSENTLVYFADWESGQPLDALKDALAQRRRDDSLAVIAVLPAGAFDSPRKEVEDKLAWSGDSLAPLQLTEDHEGGWTRTFAVEKTPSAYIVNARREFVWTHAGEPDPGALAAALDEHLLPGPTPRLRFVRPAVSVGDRAPDAEFSDDRGNQMALHRLRRRPVVLNFWQAWSAPSLIELRRLEALHAQGREAPAIVAFHGGKETKGLEEIRRRLGLSFALVPDPQHRVARSYGVRCWPTTITVDADGDVERVQLGIAHEHHDRPKGNGPPTAA